MLNYFSPYYLSYRTHNCDQYSRDADTKRFSWSNLCFVSQQQHFQGHTLWLQLLCALVKEVTWAIQGNVWRSYVDQEIDVWVHTFCIIFLAVSVYLHCISMESGMYIVSWWPCAGETASDDVDLLLSGSSCMQGLLLVGDLGIGNRQATDDPTIKMPHKAPSWGCVMINVPPSSH